MILQIEKDKAINAYREGDTKIKELLTNLFGVNVFQIISQETINRFEAACKQQGIKPHDLLHCDTDLCLEGQVANTYTMLRILAKAKRGYWTPDWNDDNQKKWYPWFEYKSSGFVVAGTGYRYASTATHVGSRLCFPNSEMAKSFAEENLELYKIILEN